MTWWEASIVFIRHPLSPVPLSPETIEQKWITFHNPWPVPICHLSIWNSYRLLNFLPITCRPTTTTHHPKPISKDRCLYIACNILSDSILRDLYMSIPHYHCLWACSLRFILLMALHNGKHHIRKVMNALALKLRGSFNWRLLSYSS